MKILYTTLCLIFSVSILNCQILGQDADGFNSILLPTANLNVDATNNVISFSLAQYIYSNEKEYPRDQILEINYIFKNLEETAFKNSVTNLKNNNKQLIDNKVLLGVELNGQSKNGFSIFLKEGLLSSKSSFLGTVGYEWNKKVYDRNYIEKYTTDEKNRILKQIEIDEANKDLISNIEALILNEIVLEKKPKNWINRISTGSIEEQIKGIEDNKKEIKEQFTTDYFNELNIENQKQLEITTKILKLLKEAKKVFKKMGSEGKLIDKELKEIGTSEANKLVNFRNEIFKQINSIKSKYYKFSKPSLKIDLNDYLDLPSWEKGIELYTKLNITLNQKIENIPSSSEEGLDSLKELSSQLDSYLCDLLKLKTIIDKQKKYSGKELDINKHIIYFRGGFNGTSFKYDLANDSTNIGDRIVNRDFQGTRFELGYTHQFKTRNFVGFNISKDFTDNSTILQPTTYKFKTIDTSVEPNLEISKELTALSGDYDKYDQYQLSADYVRMIPLKNNGNNDSLDSAADLFLNVNPYFRHRFYSNSETLNPNTAIGLGCFVFNVKKNSVGGGFFVQANDLFNKNRDNAVAFSNQINIGLVFKYAIDSFNPSSK